MSNKRSLYLVPKTLDNSVRVLGLTLDEFVPAVLFALIFFCLGKVMLSIALPIISVVLIKLLKKGQGASWLINVFYWYFPKAMMRLMLRKTPPSENREYIA